MSQNDKILKHLKRGYSLTPLTALREFQTLRLAARIHDLRAKGHNIKTEIINVGPDTQVARYRLKR